MSLDLYDDLKEEVALNDYSDVQIRFVINGEEIVCNKILFCLQTRFKFYQNQTKPIEVKYKHATVESVKIFVNWIESRNKRLPQLDTKTYLILAVLSNTYGIERLSHEIYEILKAERERTIEPVVKLDKNILSIDINQHKDDIINNIDKYIYYDKPRSSVYISPYISILKELQYEDKIEILKKAIEKGKNPSLISSFQIFSKTELLNHDISNDLCCLFQKSNTGLLLFFSFYLSKNKKKIDFDSDSFLDHEFAPNLCGENIKSEDVELQINSDNKLTELRSLQDQFTNLESKSSDLFKKKEELNKEYTKKDDLIESINKEVKSGNSDCLKQLNQIKKIKNTINQPSYIAISKNYPKIQVKVKKIDNYKEIYSDAIKKIDNHMLMQYIFTKIYLYNQSFQYVNDSFLSESIDQINLKKKNYFSVKHFENLYESSPNPIKNDGITSLILDFDDKYIFHPLFYELGFYGQPSDYSWEIFANFRIIDFEKISENINKNDNSSYYKFNEENDDVQNGEWHLIDKHTYKDTKLLPHPDDSYNCLWDDPFILKFKFPPTLFPNSIKLHLIPNQNNENQRCLKQCFNHFRVVGITNKDIENK